MGTGYTFKHSINKKIKCLNKNKNFSFVKWEY
jgi:hypothetical protein